MHLTFQCGRLDVHSINTSLSCHKHGQVIDDDAVGHDAVSDDAAGDFAGDDAVGDYAGDDASDDAGDDAGNDDVGGD